MSEEELASAEQIVKRDMRKEQLRGVYDALDSLEAALNALAMPGKSKAIDLAVEMRLKIIEQLCHVEHLAELESDAS